MDPCIPSPAFAVSILRLASAVALMYLEVSPALPMQLPQAPQDELGGLPEDRIAVPMQGTEIGGRVAPVQNFAPIGVAREHPQNGARSRDAFIHFPEQWRGASVDVFVPVVE